MSSDDASSNDASSNDASSNDASSNDASGSTHDARDWEQRLAAAWNELDAYDSDPAGFRARIAELAAERPADDPVALFEQAAAHDSTGEPEQAVRLYRRALDGGLTGLRRRRAVIQLASSLRNLGRPDVSVELLTEERAIPADRLDADETALTAAVDAFLALALADTGREREAASLALGALAPLLPRYNRSLAFYARDLLNTPKGS
ncbi:tetratricopeptide repeat protein [Streptomyces roseicoloratus]|uniref:Tetratricopeptide repeat protein n=1 Tax=Streptomyces roseicoloratus TaxID=2508722 RepID=A0ABY9RQF9_9ACTN|nr:tetratricopeptide repeat protein [Streptomyces roseicoloratus]WMX44437.1 tetratricopeptide repeat protein [Streptomyces roseicoloratus]